MFVYLTWTPQSHKIELREKRRNPLFLSGYMTKNKIFERKKKHQTYTHRYLVPISHRALWFVVVLLDFSSFYSFRLFKYFNIHPDTKQKWIIFIHERITSLEYFSFFDINFAYFSHNFFFSLLYFLIKYFPFV